MTLPTLNVNVISHLVSASMGNRSQLWNAFAVSKITGVCAAYRSMYVEDGICVAYWANWRQFWACLYETL